MEDNKINLCPFHGDPNAIGFSSASKAYATCLKCLNGEDRRTPWYRPVKSWKSAFCWKELDRKNALIKELVEVMEGVSWKSFIQDEKEGVVFREAITKAKKEINYK